MCKEHRKEMYTLTAWTGEKLVFSRPNQKRIEKAGQLFFTLFKVQSVHISPVLPIFTPFWFSVFSLGFRSYSLGQGSAVRETGGKKNRREPQISASEANQAWVWGGVGWRPPPFPSPPLASLRSSIFFLLTKLVHLSFFKAFTHFLLLTLYTLQEFNKTLTADLITSSEEFLVWNRIIEVWA